MWANDESKIQFLLVSYIRNDDSDARLTHTHTFVPILLLHILLLFVLYANTSKCCISTFHIFHISTQIYVILFVIICVLSQFEEYSSIKHARIVRIEYMIYQSIFITAYKPKKKMANLLSYLKSSTNMPHLSPAIEPKLYYLVFVVNPENRLLSSPGLLCACVRSGVHCENPRYTREQILRYVFRHSLTLPTARRSDQNGTNISTY